MIKKKEVLGRCGEHWGPQALVGMKNGTASKEQFGSSSKQKYENLMQVLKQKLVHNIHSSIIHNIPKVETTQNVDQLMNG
jgi:hypothetical protein